MSADVTISFSDKHHRTRHFKNVKRLSVGEKTASNMIFLAFTEGAEMCISLFRGQKIIVEFESEAAAEKHGKKHDKHDKKGDKKHSHKH